MSASNKFQPLKIRLSKTGLDRFWLGVNKGNDNECWEWEKCKDKNGYGHMRISYEHVKCRRYSYELHKGEIPHGMHILHSCHNTSCVNPSHLRVGTHQENMLDRVNRNKSMQPAITEAWGKEKGK